MHQVADRVASQIVGVAEQKVAERAHFDANVASDVLLAQVREEEDLKSMPHALGVQKQCVVKVGDSLVVGLSCVAESWHSVGRRGLVLLGRHDLGCVLLNFVGVVLLVDHVESCNQARIGPTTDLDVVEHLLNVRVTHDLETCKHEHELEVRHSLFGFIDNFLDDLQFIQKTQVIAVIIQKANH